MKTVIAIDGPAGSGKSTIAKLLSKKYGICYLDTGSMYRAVAYKIIRDNLDISEPIGIKQLCCQLNLEIKFVGDAQFTIIDGQDITSKIRTEEISKKSSDIAVIPDIRILLVEIQRKFAEENGCVVEGRDIGTFVFPDAKFKFFITATSNQRAIRRYRDYQNQNQNVVFDELLKQIQDRDYTDTHRNFAPLKKAEDAIEIDTSDLDIDQVLHKITRYIDEKVI